MGIVDTSKMAYPFGRCRECCKEFNSELRGEYVITHCPWCGTKIYDCFSVESDIFCDDCGLRIYNDGLWIPFAGTCYGLCERALCGHCGDWKEGECPECRGENKQLF